MVTADTHPGQVGGLVLRLGDVNRITLVLGADAQQAERIAQLPHPPHPARFDLIDHDRHVLIVEDLGQHRAAYIAPHLPKSHSMADCYRVGAAFSVWSESGPTDLSDMLLGRFYCSVDANGLFEIGSRVDVVTS